MLLNWTKNLLNQRDIKPTKSLGQNFLISEEARTKLIEAADIEKNEVVLEVGAGIGTITTELAARAKRVIAVEKDRALIPILKETTKDFINVEIIQEDILKGVYKLKAISYKLVGNIPYYLTAPLIRKFLESDNPPKTMTLMVQKEMAQRICARPPDMSILAISVQVYANPQIMGHVSRSSFWPQPEVDSAIIQIKDLKPDIKNADSFFRIVKAGFASPRKQLINNLSKKFDLSKDEVGKMLSEAGIDAKRRAETLTVKEWHSLASKFYPHQ